MKPKRGFTLIELLVVVAIIALLSGVVLASLSGSQAKGRDAKRIADINQLRLALSIYFDANNDYPVGNGSVASTLTSLPSNNYISVLPQDPSSGAYGYLAQPSGCNDTSTLCTGYILGAKLESPNSTLNDSYHGTGSYGDPAITINGASYHCSQYGSPNYVYCSEQ